MNLIDQWQRELRAVSDFTREPQPMLQLARKIAKKHGTTVPVLRGMACRSTLREARREFILEAFFILGKTPGAIGRFMGDRDRCTIVHYLKRRKRR